jgi:hypothetical protein
MFPGTMEPFQSKVIRGIADGLAPLVSSLAYTRRRLLADAGTPCTAMGLVRAFVRSAPTLPQTLREGYGLKPGGRFYYAHSWPSADEGLATRVLTWIQQAAIRARVREGYPVQMGLVVMVGNRPIKSVWQGTLTHASQATVEADLRTALNASLPAGDLYILLRAASAHHGHSLPAWPEGDRE